MFFSYWFQAKFGKSLTIYYPFSFYHGLSTTYVKKISSTTFKIKSRLPFSTFHHKTDTGLLIRGPRSFYHRSRIKIAKFVSLMRLIWRLDLGITGVWIGILSILRVSPYATGSITTLVRLIIFKDEKSSELNSS